VVPGPRRLHTRPGAHFLEAITAILAVIRRERIRVNFPIECRFVQADPLWLSPAYQRESAYIAVHMYRGMPHQDYFRRVEELLLDLGGRPHWGKLHTLTAAQLRPRYPRWDDLQALRKQVDPGGVFLNGYLKGLMGAG
jgi:FAD/FMN-containing dehydrogenase